MTTTHEALSRIHRCQVLANASAAFQPFGRQGGAAWDVAPADMQQTPLRWPTAHVPAWGLHSAQLAQAQQRVGRFTRQRFYGYLVDSLADSDASTARLLSCLGVISGAWLQVLPTCTPLFIRNDD